MWLANDGNYYEGVSQPSLHIKKVLTSLKGGGSRLGLNRDMWKRTILRESLEK